MTTTSFISNTYAAAAEIEVVRRPREDALPEHVQYRDEGCDLFASCLTCPLPRCRYDEPGGARAMMNRVRDGEIRRLRFEAGLDVDDISARFRVSRRTVFRVLQQARPLRVAREAERAGCEGRCGEGECCDGR